MNRVDSFIASCSSWEVFYRQLKELPNADKGRIFERFVELYLKTDSTYSTILRDVWPVRDVPRDVRKAINLPNRDEGIDLIARTKRGKYWAIQAKFRADENEALSRRLLATFTACASDTCHNITLQLVAHASIKPIGKRELYRNTQELGIDRWVAADWSIIRAAAKGKSVRQRPRKPRPDQRQAINAAKKHFLRNKATRGRLLAPCGTGKNLTGFWIATDALKAKTIVVAVPSLGLVRQGVREWTREFVARGQNPDWICVCSDDSVGKFERDEFVGEVADLAMEVYTDPKEIARLLRRRSKLKVVFTTYQSGNRLVEAARLAKVTFDIAIFDEAHRTVGPQTKAFAALLRDKFKARARLFMTATERRVNGDIDEVFSMDDQEDVYGKRFYEMTFKEAIERGLICDYQILTIAVTDREIRQLIEKNRLLNLRRNLTEAEARSVATGIALKRAYRKYGVKHALSFHAGITAANHFREQQDKLNSLRAIGPYAENFHVSCFNTAGERDRLIRDFVRAPRALMTNARCLGEGQDIPSIDCVAFADPKQSVVDIIQASGRAMRTVKDKNGRNIKKRGYIMVPIVVPEGKDFAEFGETTAFKQVARILTALSVSDNRIAEELRALYYGHIRRGKIIKIDGKMPVGMRMPLGTFAKAITLKVWNRVARLNYLPFEQARAWARKRGFTTGHDWIALNQSGKRPPDIPASPESVYASSGWISWPDWLGDGRRVGGWRPFEEARAWARKQGITTVKKWLAFAKSGKRPPDIPANPENVYADSGWIHWPDWLGNGRAARGKWRPFKEARTWARKQGFASSTEYKSSKQRPADIPFKPYDVYANSGWISWADFLNIKPYSPVNGWRPFKQACLWSREQGFANQKAFRSCKRPADIPSAPHLVYAKSGWTNWGYWLGTGRRRGDGWRPYKQARALARKRGISSASQWFVLRKAGKLPSNMPSNPNLVYANSGWNSWNDFLGTPPNYRGK